MAKITNFFKSKKTVGNFSDEEDDNSTIAERFYKTQIGKECAKIDCVQEKSKLQQQISETEKKIELRREQIKFAQTIIAEKNYEIARLQAVITPVEQPLVESASQFGREQMESGNQTAKINDPPMQKAGQEKNDAFAGFSLHFEEPQLADLRLIGITNREDSTFVFVAVRNLYHDRLEVLKKRSLTGRSENGDKQSLTPENVKVIKQLFKERMCQVEANERATRERNVNKLIKDSLENITKTMKTPNVVRKLFEK